MYNHSIHTATEKVSVKTCFVLRVASYEMYIIIASAYLYGLYVYPVELPSTCDIATVGKYMLQSYMPIGS